MDRAIFLQHLTTALQSVTTPRFYETERGFQGELLVALRRTLPQDFLPARAIIEQEYQKLLRSHGLAIRPDIIIHEPFDSSRHHSPDEGNLAVMELKRAATAKSAAADIESLVQMIEILRYSLAVFINIASVDTHADVVPTGWRDRIACFAVSLRDGKAHVIQSETLWVPSSNGRS